MVDQEKLYQLIFKEQWTDILDLLYTHKTAIATDILLSQAAIIFEQEFFRKVKNYPIDRKDIEDNLDKLYLLNHGRFYTLSAENYKILIIEIVKRKSIKEAVNYARYFPDDETCKLVIDEFELGKKKEGFILTPPRNIPMNWFEIYNRLFELMNNQGDAATYFSGPRFINTIKEFEPYFPDYNQFIEQRNREGKSTSRKIYYYDILLGLKEDLRVRVLNRFLEILKPFQPDKVREIEELLGKKATKEQPVETVERETASENPTVFISYSWDDEEHKEWVLHLANRLCSDGIDVILDRYHLKPGKSLPYFVENSISKAKRVIIIFTPNYKLKADKRAGGVGYEYSIMNEELYNSQTTNEKIIPILRSGTSEESIPAFMRQFIHIDTRNDENFETSYVDLIREIYNEPAIQKPELGVKPNFERIVTDEVTKPIIGNKPKSGEDATGYIHPDIIAKLKPNDTPVLSLFDGRKINAGVIRVEDSLLVHYTGKGLKTIWKPDMTDDEKKIAEELKSKPENYLIENNYIARLPLTMIVGINR